MKREERGNKGREGRKEMDRDMEGPLKSVSLRPGAYKITRIR